MSDETPEVVRQLLRVAMAQTSHLDKRLQERVAQEQQKTLRRQRKQREELQKCEQQQPWTVKRRHTAVLRQKTIKRMQKEGILPLNAADLETPESATKDHAQATTAAATTADTPSTKATSETSSAPAQHPQLHHPQHKVQGGEKPSQHQHPSPSPPDIDEEVIEKAVRELAVDAKMSSGKAQVTFKVFDLGGQSTFYIFHPFFLTEYVQFSKARCSLFPCYSHIQTLTHIQTHTSSHSHI